MDIPEFNDLCQTKFLPRVKFSNLTDNTNYKVTKILEVTSTFSDSGKAIVLDLNEALRTFILSRTSKTLTTNEMLYKNLEKVSKKELYLHYIKKGEFEFKVVNAENMQTVQKHIAIILFIHFSHLTTNY